VYLIQRFPRQTLALNYHHMKLLDKFNIKLELSLIVMSIPPIPALSKETEMYVYIRNS